MAGNANFDSLLSTTLNNYRSTLEDNVFTARPLVAFLKRQDKIRLLDGGAKIVEQLMYAQNAAAGSYSGYDTLPLTASGGISAAEFPWQQFAATIAISGLEEAENNGSAAIVNLLEAKVQQAEETIAEQFDVMFFLDGSGNTNKDWWGLNAVVSTTDPSRGSYGNIPVSGNTWWQSQVDTSAVVLSTADMTHQYNLASRGNDTPDFIITTQRLFEKYESLLQPQLRFEDNVTADAGFQNLLFKTAPIMFDANCQGNAGGTADTMYFLNSKYLKLVGHSQKWFTNSPFKVAPNQDARFAQIFCYGNLTCSNRARQAKLTNRTI